LRKIYDPIRHVGAGPLGPYRWIANVCTSTEKAVAMPDASEDLQARVERNEMHKLY
jgi:hypothetical protein